MTNALTIYGQFDQMQRAALALHKSNYFSDSKSEAQAIVKVMAGAELGLPPFASMTGIHIIQGKPALGANVIATLIKNDPRYNYRVLELTADICRIEFYENGEPCGVSEFTIAEARKAGTKNLDKFPKNMLFARTLTNGAKWYTPGVFGGAPIYTPEELGADVDEEGNVVSGSFVVHRNDFDQTDPAADDDFNQDTEQPKSTVPNVPERISPQEVRRTGLDDYEQHISLKDVEPSDYLEAAVSSANLKNFAENIVAAGIGYTEVPHVVTALTKTYADEMNEKFMFPDKDPNKRRVLVNWLVDRKADAA